MYRWALAALCLSLALLAGVSLGWRASPGDEGTFISADEKASPRASQDAGVIVLAPARVFDGATAKPHPDWVVVVRDKRIEAAGPKDKVKTPEGARVVKLPDMTLLPGLIDAHTHLLLH